MKKGDEPIVVEETFKASRERVWRALTDPREMRLWLFPEIPGFQPTPGYQAKFNVAAGGRVFPHIWGVEEAQSPRRLVVNWRYGGYPGDSTLTIELEEAPQGTRLRLTHTVTQDFPDHIPEFTRESCQAGWNHFIKQSLKQHLEPEDYPWRESQ